MQGSTPIATRRLHVALRPHIQPLAARARQKSTPPDFAIAGVEKGGTTGLAWHLRFFSVCMYGETEYHKVDSIRFLRRPTWPRPRTGCNVTGFDDPNLFYIAPTHAAQLRMAAPAIRLVVLLREPVQRAHSRWQMEERVGRTAGWSPYGTGPEYGTRGISHPRSGRVPAGAPPTIRPLLAFRADGGVV